MTIEEIRRKYPYLYETHLHTSEASACARNTGAEMARACKEYGYAGIFVTDHNWGGNTAVDRSLPWKEWVERFCLGFEHAREEGEKLGLDVFFGYEAGFDATEFLTYGIDKDWMLEHPELREAPLEVHSQMVREAGGLIMHAHPYREEWYIPEIRLFPECVDGVEGINATHSNSHSQSHNDPAFDDRAVAYAREHGLPMSAGSDMHTVNLFGGGVAFRRRLTSGRDYVRAIKGGEDYVLTNGEIWYDKNGKVIASP